MVRPQQAALLVMPSMLPAAFQSELPHFSYSPPPAASAAPHAQ